MTRARGFTLIELLVALVITALIMVIAYSGLRSITENEAHSRAADKRLRQVQIAMRIMEQDFSQLEPRPVRDGLGGVQPPLLAGPQNVPPIIFTRGGWSNPLGLTRSTEQRVAYSLEDGKLMRSWWPELDGQAQVQPAKEPLLDDVDSIKIQYMDAASKSFQDVWPPTQLAAGQTAGNINPYLTNGNPYLTANPNVSNPNGNSVGSPGQVGPGQGVPGQINPAQLGPGQLAQQQAVNYPLPIAVSITITLKDMGDLTRIVEVASCDANCNGIP